MDEIKRKLYSDGYVETLFGRRMHINIQKNSNQNLKLFSERQAINAPIQGTAADIIKLAMVKVQNKLKEIIQILKFYCRFTMNLYLKLIAKILKK